MKHTFKKTLVLLLACAMLLPLLVACGDNNTPPAAVTTEGNTEPQTPPLADLKLSDYLIIYPDGAGTSFDLISAIGKLQSAVEEHFGVALKRRSDYVEDGTKFKVEPYEILIGHTNREESQTLYAEVKKDQDYEIRMVGNKLVISALTDETLVSALTALIAKLKTLDAATPTALLSEAAAISYKGTYTLEDILIGGASIADYTLVYEASHQGESLANKLVAAIREESGFQIQASATATARSKRIFLGKTAEPLPSDAANLTSADQYYIGKKGDDVFIYAAELPALCKATDSVIRKIKESKGGTVALQFDGGNVEARDVSIVSMSFNILCDQVTAQREKQVLDTIKNLKPDTFGVQEATPRWMSKISEAVGDEYAYVGNGRDGGSNGEYSAVFYRKDRFQLIDSGTQWLSDTPNIPSKYAESEYIRIFTYAILECKLTGARFMHLNTHTDNSGDAVRLKQVKLISAFLEDYPDLPVIISGDLNAKIEEPSIQHLLNAGFETSSKLAYVTTDTYTFKDKATIDFLLLKNGCFDVFEYAVDTTKVNGEYASDHRAITVCFEIRPTGK